MHSADDIGRLIEILGEPIDISIPLNFNGPQPNAYGVDAATSKACEYGDLIGDTRRGGSCNFDQVTLIPHCNGTHTECVGHITHERISVRDQLTEAFIFAKLVTVETESAESSVDSYAVEFANGDNLITRRKLEQVFGSTSALIVRTLPNDDRKLDRAYNDSSSPYFSNSAMRMIVDAGVRHLLVDLPSIDRLDDQGKLSNHRIFWGVEPASFDANDDSRRGCTITEMVYIPNAIEDGEYVLNLQIAPFMADASPSRPLLFKIKNG